MNGGVAAVGALTNGTFTFATFAPLGSDDSSQIFVVLNNGGAIGYSYSSSSPGVQSLVRWNSAGVPQGFTLQDPNQPSASLVHLPGSPNREGVLAGYHALGGIYSVFTYDALTGALKVFPSPINSTTPFAVRSINDAGQILLEDYVNLRMFVFNPGTQNWIEIGMPIAPSVGFNFATLNSAGQVAGSAGDPNGKFAPYEYRNGSWSPMLSAPSASTSYFIYGYNSLRQGIGISYDGTSSQAIIIRDGVAHNFFDVVVNAGGWTFGPGGIGSTQIDDFGRILGTANFNGQQTAFVLEEQVPEASGLALTLGGLLVVFGLRRKT
jgi:hypothetical protein